MNKLFLAVISSILITTGCATTPRGIEPVSDFEVDRYMGLWYEIARFDHSFERGLSHVTAEYTKNENGTVNVLNRGYNAKKEEWKEANATARFARTPDIAALKVTFFWPFSGGYNVIALDKEEYQWAMVCGPNRNYLWILARDRELDEAIYTKLVERAEELGFDTSKLLIVQQLPPIED